MSDLDPYAKLDRMNADNVSPGLAVGDAILDPRALEVARLAGLPSLDYQAERIGAAGALGIGVIALDKAVRSEQARRRDAEAYAHRIQPPPAPGEVRWPPGWAMEPGGLYGAPGRNAPPVWLSAPFEVLGETRDHASEEWGLWLRWRDGDGGLHTYAMPHALVYDGTGST